MQATTRSVALTEWDRRGPKGLPVSLDGPEARTVGEELTRSGRLVVRELARGLEISSTSWVGRVRLGTLEITIAPKVGGQTLLRLLRYAYGLRDLSLLERADYAMVDSLLVDLLVAQLHAEVREIVARGLTRRYLPVRETLQSPRGRIDMLCLARRGGRVDRGLPCVHHPRLEDNVLNQTLLAGLRLAARAAVDMELGAACRRLASVLEIQISTVELTTSLLLTARRELNRLVHAYEPALTLIELLYQASGLSLEDQERAMPLSGFLFDMNRFFQTLLSRFLRENLTAWEVRDEYRISDMMRYVPGKNPLRRRSPRPRPDFAVLKQGTVRALLDAKYRDLWAHSLPREMLYQLAIYALSQRQGAMATILYPTDAHRPREQQVELSDPIGGYGRGYVVLRPVQLDVLDLLVRDESPKGRRRRAEHARWLAFGAGKVHGVQL